MNTPGLLIGPSPFSSFWICISFLKQLLLTPLFPNYYRLFLFTFSLGTQNFFFNFLSEKVFVYRIYLFFFPPLPCRVFLFTFMVLSGYIYQADYVLFIKVETSCRFLFWPSSVTDLLSLPFLLLLVIVLEKAITMFIERRYHARSLCVRRSLVVTDKNTRS